ncbi:zona pellucida sperm-binding protein 3-like [Hippocampus zosterae]|uniref:zona pellucida sperm-binding protein 3-like n=1 Tax=Hippocampus zosterae TaxID=109293 RepID=UPI00223CE23C|nr:zona pellucida sperm-binding protein 3-like [Hippocampus zosterae]
MTLNQVLLCLALALALIASARNLKLRPKVQQPAGKHFQTFPPTHQVKRSSREPLSWRSPDPPAEKEPRFPPHFEPKKPPEASDAIQVVCEENSVRVEAKRDLLGIGQLVKAEDVTLGGCPATGEDTRHQVLIFESELHQCGSRLLMSEDDLVYVFTLQYTPSPLGDTPIIRTRDVTVSIRCQYQRKHNVSSGFLNPTWTSFNDSQVSEESLYFSLRLMTDDWQVARPSSRFTLGDMMKFEVSVKQFHHTPLRVTVDDCVATVVGNVDTVPRYSFLGNNGCLFDSQLTGSGSRFLPRSRDDRLQFEVEAFKFQEDETGEIYITCSLKATAATSPADFLNKACSFNNGWTEASGVHQACSCCDADCGTGSRKRVRGNQSPLAATGAKWEEAVAVGPITVYKRPAE